MLGNSRMRNNYSVSPCVAMGLSGFNSRTLVTFIVSCETSMDFVTLPTALLGYG